jgi:hypothetical protein
MRTFRWRTGCGRPVLCRKRYAAWLSTTGASSQLQAQVYEAEGNDAQLYLLLYRHADLVLQKLQAHPDRSKPENKKALGMATATVMKDLKKLEEIAPRIKRRHEEYQERRGRQLDALKALEGKGAKNLPQELDGLSIQERGSKRRSYDSRPALDARAQENHSLAARLAQREVWRRDSARRNVRQHGVSEEEELERRSGGRWDSWQDELAGQGTDGDDLSKQLQEVARLQQNGHRTSYSAVGCHPSTIPQLYLTSAASHITVYTRLPLSLCAAQIRPRKMVRVTIGSIPWTNTCAATKGTNIQILWNTTGATSCTTQTFYAYTRYTIRTSSATANTRQVFRGRTAGTRKDPGPPSTYALHRTR